MAARNAITQRLDRLHDQWVEFSLAPGARLLRWLIRQDEYRVLETFLQKESDDGAGELPDLFLRFDVPFQDVNEYGAALLDGLLAQYAAAREELEQEGSSLGWTPPADVPGTHSLHRLLASVQSLHAWHAAELDQLVLVLTPATVRDTGEWQRWLLATARALPPTVRLVVIDDADAPALDALAAQAGPLLVTTPAALDMPAAIADLAKAGGSATPGGQFRIQFAALAQALSAGDLEHARQTGAGALAIAQENGWVHVGAAVHFALGAGMLNAGRTRDAVACYASVDAAGRKLAEAGDIAGTRLRMQAGFATGAAHVAAGAWLDGAATYEQTVPLAEAANEPLMVLDAWRMAAYCFEQARDTARAWECGHRALHVAERIPPDQRLLSMLPYAGDALLRLAAGSRPHAELVHQRLAELTGTPAWRPQQTGTAA